MYLNCKTYFSFKYGTFSTEELVRAAAEAGAGSLALTNINNTCDAWDFVKLCNEAKIKPILGAEIRNGDEFLYILLAANNKGFEWINHFISIHLEQGEAFPEISSTPFFDDAKDGFVIYPLGGKLLNELFENEYIGVTPREVNLLFNIDVLSYPGKFLIRQPVTVQNKIYFNVHRLLRAIDHNTLLSKLSPEQICNEHETFLPQLKLFEAFRNYPSLITNTYRLIDACKIEMDFKTDKNKKFFTASKADDLLLLKKLALDGLKLRYGTNGEASARVEKELKIINEMGFTANFLIAWEKIRYANSRGFYHVGRGSGANSIVAYCLKITDVDPIELNLFFERFLNPERTSPPDFDIDFSWTDRDEIFDYIFKRYGREHVAMVGTFTTFQYNAVIRELGKVFGLPKEEIDQLGEKGYYYGESRGENFKSKMPEDKYHRAILQYGRLINNFPNHLSVHAGGILISEAPIHRHTATFLPPKGFSTTMIDMYMAEAIGLYKLDILSQRGLGHIKEAIRLIKENKNIDIQIQEVEKFKKDPNVKMQLKNVNTVGCFYIESPAMRQLLTKLKCDNYQTLVVASSIIRPGVASSGMMDEYIFRYHNPDKFEYLHPIMKELLEETFGVMVFQEDVIKVAHYFGGLAMGEADTLRRAMSGKYKSNNSFDLMKEKFFLKCKERGYDDKLTAEVWRQMESFAGYSFCKAHSASFAVESFQDLFLKAYYPLEFLVGVVNNFGGFYSTSLYFYELVKAGANLNLPCVNNSDYLTSINGKEVYIGLVHIADLEKGMAEKIINERQRWGTYLHLQDFIERTKVTPEQLNILISAGAFRFTGKLKKQLLWQANFLQKKVKALPASVSMFKDKPVEFNLPELSDHPIDDLYDEFEILGFTIKNPFELSAEDPRSYSLAREIANFVGKQMTILIYYVDAKVVPTVRGTMSFVTGLDVELDWVYTVLFPETFKRYAPSGRGFYLTRAVVKESYGFYSLEVISMVKVGYKQRRYANL
jgi:DNA polymerase-3 subunit alpha